MSKRKRNYPTKCNLYDLRRLANGEDIILHCGKRTVCIGADIELRDLPHKLLEWVQDHWTYKTRVDWRYRTINVYFYANEPMPASFID